MFNFFKSDLDIRDDALLKIIKMLIVHANEVLSMYVDKKINDETLIIATEPLIKLGEIKELREYLSNSKIQEVVELEKVMTRVSKYYREEISKKFAKDKDGIK